jgi:hypothetical protein
MVILGEVLVVGGSALVVQRNFLGLVRHQTKALAGPDEALGQPPEVP